MKNAKNTPQPLRKTGNAESKLKRLVGIAKILYIGLKEMGVNIENIDCAKCKLRCMAYNDKAERGRLNPRKGVKNESRKHELRKGCRN